MKYPEVTSAPAARQLSPKVDPLEDQWDDLGYPKGTPAPAARQSRARVDVKQRERSPRTETSTPWSISLKSTISEDLSRHDKDQGAKLRFLQKRLDRETLKLFHGEGPMIMMRPSISRPVAKVPIDGKIGIG
ncbi:hypothetical protein DPV78_011195 [Talaromyces pinophilus]|nr:hypothetical protein DPV78_011195 [Talaromyces pinophilus]